MGFFTRRDIKLVTVTLAGILVSIGTASVFTGDANEVVAKEEVAKREAVYLSTSTLPLRVSGVVAAADSTVVYAETAGVVISLPAREGAVVRAGEVLAIQATPVADARLALAVAERGLSDLQQSLNTEVSDGQAVQAAYRAYSAGEIASLRAIGNDSRIREGSEALLTSLRQSVLAITRSANYVNNNRSLFTAEGLRVYDEVVRELYGRAPNYFQGSVMIAGGDVADLQTMLKEATVTKDPATLKTLSLLLNGQLTALTKLFTTGEADVFDRDSVEATESVQTEYLAERSAVLSAAQSLQTTSAAFSQVIDGVLEDGVTQQTTVNISDIDRELALTQASYAGAIATQADVVAAAGEGVVAAELSLGRPRATFAGTVSRVFVTEGQYVMPGTPLLTLVGSGARELTVSVPSYLLTDLAAGQPFVVDGETLGFVDRFSTVSEGGSGVVILTLSSDAALSPGTTLAGEILIPSELFAVPRAYVHFDADGAYLIYESGAVTRATIVYDTGATLYVTVDEVRDESLSGALSIAF